MLTSSGRHAADPTSICPTCSVDRDGKLASTIQPGWARRTSQSNTAHSKMSRDGQLDYPPLFLCGGVDKGWRGGQKRVLPGGRRGKAAPQYLTECLALAVCSVNVYEWEAANDQKLIRNTRQRGAQRRLHGGGSPRVIFPIPLWPETGA